MAQIKPFEIPWTPVHNYVFDEIMPKLSPNGWKVLCVAIRQTLGWAGDGLGGRKEWDTISYAQFLEKTGIGSDKTLTRALKECLNFGYLLRRQVGTHQGTRKPIYAYRLNTQYTATVKTTVAATIKTTAATTIDSTVTKQRETNKQNDDDLSKRLMALGVHEGQARKWAFERPAEMVQGWMEFVRRNSHGLSNAPGFLVSKLKAGEEPPAMKRPEGDRRRYIEGPYSDLIEH